jgi:hypothetical protein
MCFTARRHGDSYQQNTNDTKSELTGFLSMDGSDFTDKMAGQSAVPSGLRPIQRDTPNLERLGYFRASLRDEAEVLRLQNIVPTLAICWSLDEGGGLGGVGGAEVLVIPVDFLSGTVRDIAEVIGFGGPT